MKILVFTNLFPNNIWPNHGVFIKERMLAVSRLNESEVRVVAPVPYYPPIRAGSRSRYSQVAMDEVIQGLRVYHPRYYMIPKVSMLFHGLLIFLSVLSSVQKIRRDFDFDVIDAHYVFPDGFAAILLGRWFGRPVIVSARGSDINVFAAMPLIRRMLRYTLHHASRVIAVSGALKKAIVGLGIADDKVSIVPNGVDPEKFHPISKMLARDKLGIAKEKKLILSVGGLTSVKGFDLLIRGIRILIETHQEKEVILVIVGEGPLRDQLERLIVAEQLGQHVYLAGEGVHEELYIWYSAADIFCLASQREGWPNVILEAMACGLPVVAADVGGIPEMIAEDSVGLLTSRDPTALAAALHQAMQRDWDADRIVRYARQFTWEAAAVKVKKVFDMALDHVAFRAKPVTAVPNINFDRSDDADSARQ